ncbi:MAG: hypothetical protein ACJ8H8_11145 [Geminicoccaceae bacterium]
MRFLLAAIAALLLASAAARAGMLLEADLAGTAVWLEVGGQPDRVLAKVAGRDYRIDLATAAVVTEGRQLSPSLPEQTPAGTLEPWSDGPVVAGYGTTYQVLIVGERICGEALVVAWMAEFTRPLARALELLERTLPSLAPRAELGCGRLGFAAFAREVFPLMAGDKGAPFFQVRQLRFDYYPAETAFGPPPGAEP